MDKVLKASSYILPERGEGRNFGDHIVFRGNGRRRGDQTLLVECIGDKISIIENERPMRGGGGQGAWNRVKFIIQPPLLSPQVTNNDQLLSQCCNCWIS